MRLWGKSVAVELSGGLDTSIIIGLLLGIGIEPILIGHQSERFQFRTERKIQRLLASTVRSVFLYDEADHLPFSELYQTPAHLLPNKSSLFHNLHQPTIRAAQAFGAGVVLNGIGFDSLLIEPVGLDTPRDWAETSALDDPWANEYVFQPNGIYYRNAATIPFVRRMLLSLREGQGEDVRKVWARSYFREFLPRELSDYAYKASFGAIYNEGLQRAQKDIVDICQVAFKYTRIAALEADSMSSLIESALNSDQENEFELFVRASYALWIYSMTANGRCLSH